MTTKNRFLKIFLKIIIIISSIIVALGITAFICFRFVFVPKFNSGITDDNEKLASSDFIDIASDLTDKQLMNNILNFDKESARYALDALKEIGTEENILPENAKDQKNQYTDEEKSLQAAYERIMKAAEKSEIEQGLAIIKKIDIKKVTELRNEGKLAELKAYIKSVLTSDEITVALELYFKYKHLL